jgi:predicted Zn finger-like uncharacterized protein
VIVTCHECQTQFQLDDAKVPKTGIRVRCSRCKFAFFVESPHRPDPDHASQLAREALGADRGGAGEPSLDSNVPDEESDWQFNEDVDPVADASGPVNDLAAARSAVDDLLGGISEAPVDPVTGEHDSSEATPEEFADDSGLDIHGTDLSVDSELEFEPDDDPNAVTVDRGNWAGPSADLSSDSGLDLDGPGVADVTDDSDIVDDADSDIETDLDAAPESAVDASDSFGEVPDDLGSPAGWDFFEENDAPPSPGLAAVPESRGSSESDSDFGSDELRAFAASDDASALEVEASRGDAWFTRLRGLLGWSLVTALCAYACTIMFFPALLAPAPEPITMRVAGFEVAQIEGHWVENAAAGSIYVVSGALHSTGGTRPAPDSVLKVRLLDAHGAEVLAESGVVGPPIATLRLRESNLDDLRAAQERAASAILHDPLGRRKRRPFMAVLGEVPADAVALDLAVTTMAAPATRPIPAVEAASAP